MKGFNIDRIKMIMIINYVQAASLISYPPKTNNICATVSMTIELAARLPGTLLAAGTPSDPKLPT